MSKHHKITTHPIGFTISFLASALSMLPLEEGTCNALKVTSALALLVAIYSLYKENRLQKAFRPITNYFSSLWSKLNNGQTENPSGQPAQLEKRILASPRLTG